VEKVLKEVIIALNQLPSSKELQSEFEGLQNEINGYTEEFQLPDYRSHQIDYCTVKYKDKSPKSRGKTKKIKNLVILNMENKKQKLGKMYLREPFPDIPKKSQKIRVELTECQKNEIIKKELGGSGDITITEVYYEISEKEFKEIRRQINERVRDRVLCFLNEIKRDEDENIRTCLTQSLDNIFKFLEKLFKSISKK